MKKIREQADFDAGQQTPTKLHPFDKQEFSDRGRADLKVRPNDARYGDNPMDDRLLDEFAGESEIDRLHQMFSRAGISDQQIRGGVSLTQAGTSKVAARLGISPDDVKMYINSLVQQLRDDDETSMERLEEQYYNALYEDGEAGQSDRPFEPSRDRYSYEQDALGSLTVRDATTGRSHFVQGAAASVLLSRLEAPGAKPEAILAPLVEKALPDTRPDFWSEIEAKAGTFNFLWKLGHQHGTGTAMFHTDPGPSLELVDVRDEDGNEMDVDAGMHRALLQQARDFLGKE